MQPWHHCALCLRQLGFGTTRLASRFHRNEKVVQRFIHRHAQHIHRPALKPRQPPLPAGKTCPLCKQFLPLSAFDHCGLRAETQHRRRSCRACLVKYYDRVTFADTSGKCAVCLMRLGFGLERITRRLFGSPFTNGQRGKVASLLHRHRALKVFDAHAAYRKLHPPKPPPPPRPALRPDWDDLQSRKPQREITRYLAAQLWLFIKHAGSIKRIEWLIGCSRADFLQHLSDQFTPEMSFANYGSVWELDHFIPCAAFNLQDKLQRTACFNFLNLRPAIKHDHRVKGISTPNNIPVFLHPDDYRVDPAKFRFPRSASSSNEG